MKVLVFVLIAFCFNFDQIKADTAANCTYEDIKGLWVFHEGPRGNVKTVNCTDVLPTSDYYVNLEFPSTAIDQDGNVGFWTIIYNQGFEVVINNRKYFAFSYVEGDMTNSTSYCYKTFGGWSHKTGMDPSDWSCYIGEKQNMNREEKTPKVHSVQTFSKTVDYHESKPYHKNADFVNKINSAQSLWQATHYDFLEKNTIADLVKMAGGKKSKIIGKPKPAPVSAETEKMVSSLPDSFDWRNVSGVNYLSAVRNQGSCGSCYAFASLGMNEARLRIKSMNADQTIFSTQDIVECSEYSQGCDGGFPYLISGKYAEDFGLVAESCNPYTGKDGTCHTDMSCKRRYGTKYHYVGGFYGACNAHMMQIELVRDGPVEVAFQVYDDFFNYKGGIYHHTFMRDTKNFRFNPFELTNHAVLVVGYGHDDSSNQDYWIVKNSWGTGWGENGFFRILRGTDECAIESIAVGSDISLA